MRPSPALVLALLLAGCLGTFPGSSPTATPPAPTATPPVESTPAAGSCTAVLPSTPAPDVVAREFRPYPDRPRNLTRASVRRFVRRFERARVYNRLVAKWADTPGRMDDLEVSVTETTVHRAGGGFHVVASSFGYVTDRRVESPTASETPTPAAHHDYRGTGGYYVTERFALRNGTAVACW